MSNTRITQVPVPPIPPAPMYGTLAIGRAELVAHPLPECRTPTRALDLSALPNDLLGETLLHAFMRAPTSEQAVRRLAAAAREYGGVL